jgi:hypothetical protein
MEFRAAHSAAILIVKFEELAGKALQVTEAGPGATTFVNATVPEFFQVRDRLNRSWETTKSPDVNQAVKAVYDSVAKVEAAIHNAASDLKVAQALANNREPFRGLVPPLEKVVGTLPSANRNAAELARDMRKQRSIAMGFAAGLTKQLGVWKIGDLHIADLTDGTVKVNASWVNFVTKEDFNREFEAWQQS